jgi:hypothetical protein
MAPNEIAKWLGRAPDAIVYALLAGAVGAAAWATHTTYRLSALETKVDDIHTHLMGDAQPAQSSNGAQHATR